MTTLRSARSKGSQFEIDTEHSLRKIYPDIRRCGGEGMYLGYDLISDSAKMVFECKFHKSISWNECVKLYNLLSSRCPTGYTPYLIIKSNRQPVLVFTCYGCYTLVTFDSYFHTSWEKHGSSPDRMA